MELLEIMKRWGVNDTPNDIQHFEQEVREYYRKIDIDKKVDLGSCSNCFNSDKETIIETDGVVVCAECFNSWLIE